MLPVSFFLSLFLPKLRYFCVMDGWANQNKKNLHGRRASATGGSKPSLRGGLVMDASLGDVVAGDEAALGLRDSG